jgi:FixJ family two-component response regulator
MEKAITEPQTTVFLVDDDETARHAATFLLEAAGCRVRAFGTGEELLAECPKDAAGCVVLDVRLPGLSGLGVQDELIRRQLLMPVIVLTGYGEVSLAVRAFQRGAFDFIEKPYPADQLIDSVQAALTLDGERRRRAREQAAFAGRVGQLTPREREVMAMVVVGKANKVVAYELGIAEKTVETHRAKVMEKMGVGSLAELVRLDALHGAAA